MKLIKFYFKKDVRKLTKSLLHFKCSSIFKSDNKYYIIIDTTERILSELILEEINFNEVEKIIFLWGRAEINNSFTFIKYETQSVLANNGRQINYNGYNIIRTFTYLSEIFAIINFNSDSFSDGGKYNNIDKVIQRVDEVLSDGAEIIDIGIESTGYNAKPISSTYEIKQLKSFLPEIITLKKHKNFKISIDTYHDETVNWLNDFEIDIINDVSGNLPLNLIKKITDNSKDYVAMHSLVIPSDREKILSLDHDPIINLIQWQEKKICQLDSLNINLNQIIFDYGIGFGKNASQSWYILNNLNELNQFKCEILVGHSRKSLFTHLKDSIPHQRDIETAVSTSLIINQVDYFRLHDLKYLNQIYPVVHHLKMN